MITREADYAIRVVLYLARRADDEKTISTAELSDEMEIPYRFLRKIVRRMVDAGLVLSQRGKGGGVSLAVPAAGISLLDVLHAIDPKSVMLNACLEEDPNCDRLSVCPAHLQFKGLQEALDKGLHAVTFDQLSTE